MTEWHTPRRPLLLALALASLSAASHADAPYADAARPWAASSGLAPMEQVPKGSGPFGLCPPFGPELPNLPALAPTGPAQAEADHARHDGRMAEMQGDVRLQRGDQRLLAEHIRYTLAPEQAEVDGDLRYWDSTSILFARQGTFWPGEDRGQLEAVRFWLPQNHLSGESAKVTRLNARQDHLDTVSLSSCPPDKRDWVLEAASMDLDHGRGRGVAHDTWLSFKGVPLFYSPWLDFPLDERRASGFLYPSLGISSQRGIELGLPYYWNIAPDRDATLTIRPMSQRGLMLQGEYRQLWQDGSGQVNLDWLPQDQDSGQQNRYLVDAHADGRLAGWNSSLALRRASDRDFMRDFSLTPWGSITDYLESHARTGRNFGNWNLLLNAQQWQPLTYNVTEAARPYRRLPQARLTGHEDFGPFNLTLDTEAVHFAHEFEANPEGERYAIQPAISLPIQDGWYSITPRVALDSTHYQIDTGSFARTTPITSLDTRLFFDRYGETLHQQLEPRLYYLHVPYREQDWQLFDTGLASPSLSRLFAPNRFVGRDRLGDANALSYALTWRALDAKEGFERASVALGQRYRFNDERVTLNPGDPSHSSGAGEVMGEVGIGLSREWRLRLTAATDANIDKLTQTYALLGYRSQNGHLFNLHYAQHKDDPGLPDLEQAGASFVWRASPQWRLLGSVVEDLKGDAVIQALAGVEYNSCCWRLRVGARRFVVDSPDISAIETDTAVLIQLELKGLGGLGQQADRQFERDILGFSSLQAD